MIDREILTIEKVDFNVRTQALLNFTPIIFYIKHKDIIRKAADLTQANYFSDETYKVLGSNFMTFIDKENRLWEIKINKFPKEYERIMQTLEGNYQLIPTQFNLIEAGITNVNFFEILNWANNKHVMPKRMRERTTYKG